MYRIPVKQIGTTSAGDIATRRSMSDIAQRLADLRIGKGFKSKADAARAYGLKYESYKSYESGNRGLPLQSARAIARYHRISLGWLMAGQGNPHDNPSVPLQGKIGAGQEMMLFEDGVETVEAHFDIESSTAFEIQGDSMMPVARDKDIVFFGPERRDVASLVHHECAVVLQDGRRFFKILQNGSRKGLYSLASYNGATIADVEVHSAGPFLGLMRR